MLSYVAFFVLMSCLNHSQVLWADIERSSKASARMILQSLRGQTPQMDGVQKQRTAQTQQDCIAMIGFLFFAMNTFPLTPLLLPTALKISLNTVYMIPLTDGPLSSLKPCGRQLHVPFFVFCTLSK
jgi:hypothetical protein